MGKHRFWLSVLIVLISMGLAWMVSAQESLTQEQLQQAAYARHCGTCHLALPAEVMPSQTWERLLADPDHYGQRIQPPLGVDLQLAWSYLRPNSRPVQQGELVPFRLPDSRFFQALHPDVTFPYPPRVTTCIDCHPQAELGDFFSLKEEAL